VCEPCGQRGSYSIAKLMAEHGGAKLTDLLMTPANCAKAHSVSVHDRCNAVCQGSGRVAATASNAASVMAMRIKGEALDLEAARLSLAQNPAIGSGLIYIRITVYYVQFVQISPRFLPAERMSAQSPRGGLVAKQTGRLGRMAS